jgi:hypothetical protein
MAGGVIKSVQKVKIKCPVQYKSLFLMAEKGGAGF